MYIYHNNSVLFVNYIPPQFVIDIVAKCFIKVVTKCGITKNNFDTHVTDALNVTYRLFCLDDVDEMYFTFLSPILDDNITSLRVAWGFFVNMITILGYHEEIKSESESLITYKKNINTIGLIEFLNTLSKFESEK